MRLLLLSLLLTSCSTTNSWTRKAGQPDAAGLSKFENEETICYLYVSEDGLRQMLCKWKELPVEPKATESGATILMEVISN